MIRFNRKTGIVRSLVSTPTSVLSPTGALVSPSTQYRNRRLLAALIKKAKSRLWWFDAHMPRAGLQFIYDEATFSTLTEVRILSCGRSELGAALLDEYMRFRQELSARGVSVEWRILVDRDEFTNKHDRWVLADDDLWNVPPFSAVMGNKYGSLLPDPASIPLDEWWKIATPIDKV